MKLRFRADPKDWFIFSIFLIVLFYLVSIAVLNAITFLQDGTLSGLNPFPVFSDGLIAPVMVFYIIIVIVVFTSLNSYFFITYNLYFRCTYKFYRKK